MQKLRTHSTTISVALEIHIPVIQYRKRCFRNLNENAQLQKTDHTKTTFVKPFFKFFSYYCCLIGLHTNFLTKLLHQFRVGDIVQVF